MPIRARSTSPRAHLRVFAILVIDMTAFGLVIPVFPRLIQSFVGNPALAARYIGWFGAAWALASLLALPVLSALSDRFGRRPVLMNSISGIVVEYAAMALAPSLGWLFAGRVASGLTAATFATSSAYLADITPPAERAARYGIVSVAISVGYILGPALGGVLGDINLRLPFWVGGALELANLCFVAFFLPESLEKSKRAPFSFRRANPIAAVGLYARTRAMLALGVMLFLYYLAGQASQTVLVPYVTYRYHWNIKTVGVVLGVLGVATIAVQGRLMGPMVSRFGERRTLATGLTAAAIGFAVYGAAPSTAPFVSAVAFLALGGLTMPALQGLLTQMVSPSEQGRLQGANMGLLALASLGGPILFSEIFARAITDWRDWAPIGAPFFVASALVLLALSLALPRRQRLVVNASSAMER
jgi:DHA1 family tetracycline resistance protein-like MFS transporter